MTFFSGLASAAVGLLAMLAHALPLNARLLNALAAGLLCAIGTFCIFAALKHTAVATVSQYHYTQLVSGSIIAFPLFDEKPTLWMLAGTLLIIAAGFYIALWPSRALSTNAHVIGTLHELISRNSVGRPAPYF